MSISALTKLSKKCWEEYEFVSSTELKNALKTIHMPEAMPILFFGDYEKYFSSKIKIITVAINPSRNEFPKADPFNRFPAMKAISTANKNDYFYERYLDSLKNYYYHAPYKDWFNQYNHVLSGVNSGYSAGRDTVENTALHTDLYSPFPTDPVWNGLSKEQQHLLIEKGIQLWRELVEILQPDIILMSTAHNMTEKLGFDFVSEWEVIHSIPEKADGELRAQPYLLKRRNLKLSNEKEVQLFFGPAGVTPFQLLSNKKKREVGEVIMSSYRGNSQSTFVQFMHPGGEHKPQNGEDIFAWNKNDHKRKFLKNPGKYITGLDNSEVKNAELMFWGEWEAQSKVLQKLDGVNGPNYLHEPFYEKPTNYTGKQNTDPFIFGDNFYYTCCRQYRRSSNGKLSPTLLTRLQFGSLILFGSCVQNEFVLDTVFVVDRNPIQHNADTIDEVVEGLPETYVDVTIAPLYPENFSESDKTKPVDTSKSCLVNFETQEAGDENEELEEGDQLTFHLYKGVTYENRHSANGMFSFFPCQPYADQNVGFRRPVIKIDDFLTGNLMMGYKASNVDQETVKRLWESVVEQVIKQELVLGVQTDFPKLAGEMAENSKAPEEIPMTNSSSNAFISSYETINEREDILDSYESYLFYKGPKEYWFAPASFKNTIPVLTNRWKSRYAFSYFFYKMDDRLGLKLELGPYNPTIKSRRDLLNFLHEKDRERDKRFTITRGALANEDGKYSRLVKEEIEVNDWDDMNEISHKMNVLLDRIDFSRLNQYLTKLYKEFVQ
ncbi:hypothetical protein D0469_09070 [Peribacillus saganii]|uniref:Uncharacterized protein n=1 Tax=Peribacillus saganii TaxID=2303992 RepID=A0A372LQ62_9BACI|nr:hypothetical protein [Peribacillus saganii]RFU69506.1 hypothetical protein D0469_09070 [Peribacillus saganii]